MRKILFSLFITILFLQCDEVDDAQFSIKGEYKGNRDSEILFRYFDTEGNKVLDTVHILNGEFKLEGLINGPSLFSVYGNLKSNQFNDKNATQFFIEPKTNKIKLVEDQFHNVQVIGSKTHNEWEELKRKTQYFKDDLSRLMAEREKMSMLGDNNKVDSIDVKWSKKLSERIAFELKYALDHNDSYLSGYLVDRYFPKIPYDSIRVYYNNLELHVQNSMYGISILKKIQQRKEIKIGVIAPNFRGIDHLGNSIHLKGYRGKYVLIDFWASWCEPCRKNSPQIRKLYSKYNDQGFDIIGISLDDYSGKWRAAIKKDSLDYWSQLITPRRGNITIPYNIHEIPDYILINPEGIIIGRKSKDQGFTISDISAKLDSIFRNN